MAKKVSLKDIAQKAGVSTTLVSYVLNNQKENRINKDTARRIREAARQLNYRTNEIAKSLKTKKTYTIGLIVADISSPFSSGLARIIEDEADKHCYTVIFGSSDENAQKSGKLIDTLLNRQVDGLILLPPAHSEQQIRELRQQGIPFVLLDRYFPSIRTSYVILDNYQAAYDAVQHLVDTGRKRIGMIGYDTELVHLLDRRRGYQAALKDNGILFKKSWLKTVSIIDNHAEIEKAMHDLLALKPPVDAVLFSSNSIAAYGLRCINGLSVKVPGDLAVISFDETESLDLFYAPLTYVKQPLPEMARMALSILLENIGKNDKTMQVEMKAALVVRQST